MLVGQAGLSLVDAATICATTPARELGLVGHGLLTIGAVADLVVLDAQLTVVQTYIGGQLVYARNTRPPRPSNSPEAWAMKLAYCSVRTGLRISSAVAALAVVLAGPGCVDIVGADLGRFTDRDEKRFTVSGTPRRHRRHLRRIHRIRPWDKPEVEVVIEKHGKSKAATDAIEVHAEHDGNRVTVEARLADAHGHGFGIHFNDSRSAKLIVSLPKPPTSSQERRSGFHYREQLAFSSRKCRGEAAETRAFAFLLVPRPN